MIFSSSDSTLIFCTYFADGSLKSLTDVSGKTVFYQYDWRGKLSEIKDDKGQTIVSYTHTPGGRLKEMTHGNGIHTRYAYDTDGNIIHLRIEKGDGETISDLRYTYDLNGNRTLKAGVCLYPNGSLAEQTISYGYDQMDRLISEVRNDEESTYFYDLCGNRQKSWISMAKRSIIIIRKISWSAEAGAVEIQLMRMIYRETCSWQPERKD